MITNIKIFKTSNIFLKKAWDESIIDGQNNFDKFFDSIGQTDPNTRKQLKDFWDYTVKNTDDNEQPEWSQLGDKDPYFSFLKQIGIEARR